MGDVSRRYLDGVREVTSYPGCFPPVGKHALVGGGLMWGRGWFADFSVQCTYIRTYKGPAGWYI